MAIIYPLLTKWSQLQIVKSDIHTYIINVPVSQCRKLLNIFESGYFSINYLHKKLAVEIEKGITDDKRELEDLVNLVYAFEDFMLTSFKKVTSPNEHLCSNVERHYPKHSELLHFVYTLTERKTSWDVRSSDYVTSYASTVGERTMANHEGCRE